MANREERVDQTFFAVDIHSLFTISFDLQFRSNKTQFSLVVLVLSIIFLMALFRVLPHIWSPRRPTTAQTKCIRKISSMIYISTTYTFNHSLGSGEIILISIHFCLSHILLRLSLLLSLRF